jgi:uncharacterized protein YndB with AHSA1/START domain
MRPEKITIKATIQAEKQKTWDYYTAPNHITQWNFADISWHCPTASNDLSIGGKFFARMEAKDGGMGFDLIAFYTEIEIGSKLTYAFDGRVVNISFTDLGEQTEVVIIFDPETEHPLELQKQGWQAILNNFKSYAESI